MPGWASLGIMYKDGFLPMKGHQELGMKDARLGLFPRVPQVGGMGEEQPELREIYYLVSHYSLYGSS